MIKKEDVRAVLMAVSALITKDEAPSRPNGTLDIPAFNDNPIVVQARKRLFKDMGLTTDDLDRMGFIYASLLFRDMDK